MTRYGPHRPDSDSARLGWVNVIGSSRKAERTQVPLMPEVAEQRRQLNEAAYDGYTGQP